MDFNESNLLQKTRYFTEYSVDLHEEIPFQKSHFVLLQIIEWLVNTAAYA